MSKNFLTENVFYNSTHSPFSNQLKLLCEIEELKNQFHLLNNSKNQESQLNDDDYLTENQVCEMLQRSKPTLWRYRKKKILPFYRLAGIGIRYKRKDVINLLKNINHD